VSKSVYEEEEEALAGRPKGGGGGGDYNFLTLPKPSKKGQKLTRKLRVVQRLPLGDDGEPDPSNPFPKFWVRVDVHRFKLEGENKMMTCPDNHDAKDWASRITCPLCKLEQALWKSKRDEYQGLAKQIFASGRCYANVIDMEDDDSIAEHWKEIEGGWDPRPKVWGYSLSVHKDLMAICRTSGAIEDMEVGRNFIIEIERVGESAWDIRYPRCIPMDREPLDERLHVLAQRAFDLEGLAKPASMEDLRQAAAMLDPGLGIDFGGTSTPDPRPGTKRTATAGGPPGSATTAKPGGAKPPPARGAKKPEPEPEPEQEDAIADDTEYHYAGPGVTVHGDALDGESGVAANAIAEAIAADPTPGVHMLWADGWPEWVAADEIETFAALFEAPAEEEPEPEEEPAPPPPPPPRRTAAPPAKPTPPKDSAAPKGGYPAGTPKDRKGPPAGPPKPPAPPAPPGKGGKKPGGPPGRGAF